MPRRIDYEPGYIFPDTWLQVIGRVKSINGRTRLKCLCLYEGCGNFVDVDAKYAKTKKTVSCGCYRKAWTIKKNFKHGKTGDEIYVLWQNIKKRCYSHKNCEYHNYGERGISVCDEWKSDYMCFRNFCMSNGWRKGLEIDRIDNNGNYSPENCRFVTGKENVRNRRRTLMLYLDGVSAPLIEHAERLDIKYMSAYKKFRRFCITKESLNNE